MKIEDILKTSSMPIASPTYPRGPYRFVNREYFVVTYVSDPEAIHEALPEPLEPDGSNTVFYEFMRMPDGAGFGDYTQTGIVIPAKFAGEPVNFIAQMYLDCEPPIAGGREIWGFPQKFAHPRLEVAHDTLTGRLEYAGQPVAIATMVYKHENLMKEGLGGAAPPDEIVKKLLRRQVNLKLIPHVDGSPAIAQLVSYALTDVQVRGAWAGPARLHLIPHVNAPLADLPVVRVVGSSYFIADVTLPYGNVLHDYLAEARRDRKAA